MIVRRKSEGFCARLCFPRDPDVVPIEALRLLAHRSVRANSPYLEFSARGEGFIKTIEASETLKARARAIRDEIAGVLAVALSISVGRQADDRAAHLAAGLLVAIWTVGLRQAHETYRRTKNKTASVRRVSCHRRQRNRWLARGPSRNPVRLIPETASRN